jgi:hypothetical protein
MPRPEEQVSTSEVDNDGYLAPRVLSEGPNTAGISGAAALNSVDGMEVAEYHYIFINGKKV